MSEVTTLKQLMLDAARYRWLRDNFDELDIESIWMMGRDEFDLFVDSELEKENP